MILSADSSANTFRRYFDRKEYVVMFYSNYPDGTASETQSMEFEYGETLKAPADLFVKEGYWLTGWEDRLSGANYSVGKEFYNADSGAEPDEIPVNKNTVLFAVWLKGYVNVFGGDDYIFLSDEDSSTVYLFRGGVFFKGEYSVSRKEFTFVDDKDEVLLDGKINDDGTYSYYNAKRSESFNTLYKVGEGLVDDTNIYFDEYNGIRYVEGKSVSYGSYRIDESGQYIATFDSGDLAGRTLVLLLGSVTLDDVETAVFRVRNDDEYNMGTICRGVVSGGVLTYYLEEYYSLVLNGFGTATYNGVSAKVAYYYTLEGDTLTLTDSDGNTAGIARVFQIGGRKCYMFYNETFDRTFEDGAGAQLTLDGICSATYTNGTISASGYYTVQTSLLGGTIVTVETGKETYKFLIRETATGSGGGIVEEGDQTTSDGETVYTLEVKSSGYAEYYYKDESKIYYAPMLVTDDPAAGKAILYGYTSSREFVKVSEGSYERDENTGWLIYRAEKRADPATLDGVLTEPIDVAKIISFKFALGVATVSSTDYNVNYWFSYTTEEGTDYFGTTYTAEDGGTLILVSGMAIYSANGESVSGSYTASGDVIALSSAAGKLFFEVDEDSGKFILLEEEPYQAIRYCADGSVNRNEYLSFDGKGGVVYHDGTENEYAGRIENTGKETPFGVKIYRFTSDSGTLSFELIRLYSSEDFLFAVYDERYDGYYLSDDGILLLDGFGYYGRFIDVNGGVHEGRYSFVGENEIRLAIDGGYRYFNLSEDSFSLRGKEYGDYVRSDNRSVSFDEFFELDGYGNLAVFVFGAGGERQYTGQGTYEIRDDEIFLSYAQGNENREGAFRFGSDFYTYGDGRYGELVLIHEEIVRTYVNANDWSILILDDAGNAVKYDENGVKQSGKYILITDELLYFETDDGSDACIYTYNTATGSAVLVKFTAKGYYTKDLDSLLFSQYGFAIFNGGERCFYNIVNNDVLIYRQDASDPSASVYGFVEENFGRFDNTKEYNGKTYYSNNGFAIQFKRAEEGKEKYPVVLTSGSSSRYPLETLSFSPDGNGEFTVSGIIAINGRNYIAYVTRAKDENGDIYMYMTVGSYRFDIEISYNGEDSRGESLSTYTITAMRGIVSAPAYVYLDNYYKYYVAMGASYSNGYENNIGVVSVNYVYNEAGEEVSRYISGLFGEGSRMYDANGNVLSFEEADCEYDEVNSVYIASIAGADGYTYRFCFGLRKHPAYRNTYGYYVYFLSRIETLTTDDGYTVSAERIVVSDNPSWSQGLFRGIVLEKDGKEIAYSGAILSGDKSVILYISRETDENGKITSSVYYRLSFTENSGVELGEEKEVLATYKSVTVGREEMTVLCTADGETFIEIDPEGIPVLISVGETVYLIFESDYDEETLAYTVSAGGKTFVIRLAEDKQSIAEITEKTE